MNLFITGSTGFIGKHLSETALKKGMNCTLSVRQLAVSATKRTNVQYVNKIIAADTLWTKELNKMDCVIHAAALAHQVLPISENNYRIVNTQGTLNIAQQAADTGVKRFIFISSIKVNGESTELGKPFRPDDSFIPTDPYGLSKYEAEVGLRKIADETGMEVVIIRPPLVYGPGVKANFASLMKWVNKRLPLPLGGIKHNKRSLVAIDNLVDLIFTCIDHPKAANQTFLISDNDDISTTGLLQKMAFALGVPCRLLPIPAAWFIFVSHLLARPTISQRLCGSLQVDISKTMDLLAWTPPYTSEECMKKTADAFLNNMNKKEI